MPPRPGHAGRGYMPIYVESACPRRMAGRAHGRMCKAVRYPDSVAERVCRVAKAQACFLRESRRRCARATRLRNGGKALASHRDVNLWL